MLSYLLSDTNKGTTVFVWQWKKMDGIKLRWWYRWLYYLWYVHLFFVVRQIIPCCFRHQVIALLPR